MVGYIKILNIPIGQKKKNILKRKKFTNWYYLFKINIVIGLKVTFTKIIELL